MACTSCGEVDLSPCLPTIPVDPIPYKKCNPCKKASCKQKLDSQCVIYKWNQDNCGEGLEYLNIQNNTKLEDIIEVIDSEFNKITKPTLLNCFVTETGIDLTNYRLNDVLTKLQEAYCQRVILDVDNVTTILEMIRDTPSLKELFCEIVASC